MIVPVNISLRTGDNPLTKVDVIQDIDDEFTLIFPKFLTQVFGP
jgi:hypothetical protein